MLDRLARRSGTAANAGLAVVFAAVLTVQLHNLADSHRSWLLDGTAALVVCAAALLRERGRAWAAAVGLAAAGAAGLAAWLAGLPGEPGPAAALAVGVLLGSAARWLPLRTAAAIVAGAAVVAAGVMYTHPDLGSLPVQGWGAALAAGLWLRFLDARRHAAIETVRRGERLDLARELHDTAAHHITGIVLQAQAARIAAGKDPGAVGTALAGIETAGTGALSSLRRVIGLLRDGDDAAGLAPAPESLSDLVARFARHGPPVTSQLPAAPEWPPEVTTTVYRVVQEALANIARHAPGAACVGVCVSAGGHTVTVEVTDDAPPSGPARFPHPGGYGLIGMRERVEALGGTLRAGPRPGGGWAVHATVPAAGGRA